jgi:chromate transport protein ChrA
MRQYFSSAFGSASLAYTLYFVFAVTYNQPLGAHDFLDAYLFGFLLHMPLWFMILLIGGIFNQRISKLKNINQIIKISISAILAICLIPIFDKDSREHFDFLILIFYAFDFTLCYLVFVKTLQKQKLEL